MADDVLVAQDNDDCSKFPIAPRQFKFILSLKSFSPTRILVIEEWLRGSLHDITLSRWFYSVAQRLRFWYPLAWTSVGHTIVWP